MAECRSCGASITWTTTAKNGKPMPVDAAPVADGNLVVIKGVARAATAEDRKLHRELYRSHFSTCPNAGEYRK